MSTPSHQPRAHELSVLLSSLLADEKEHTRSWLRAEMDRLVDPLVSSIFDRLTNKLANAGWDREDCHLEPEIKEEFDDDETTIQLEAIPNQTHNPSASLTNASTASNEQSNHNLIKSEDEDQHQVNHTYQQNMAVNPLDHIESTNSQMDHSVTFNAHPSTSTHCRDFIPQHSIGYELEKDPVLLAQVKREIIEEQKEMILKNLRNNAQIGDCDEYEQEEDMSDQAGHIDLYDQVNSSSRSTDDHQSIYNTDLTLSNERIQLANQPIDHDHKSNVNVHNATDNDSDTQQDWDEPEVDEVEGNDGQDKVNPNNQQFHVHSHYDTNTLDHSNMHNQKLNGTTDKVFKIKEEFDDQVNHNRELVKIVNLITKVVEDGDDDETLLNDIEELTEGDEESEIDQMQMIIDNEQVNNDSDSDTQQDLDEHEIEEEKEDGQMMHLEEDDEEKDQMPMNNPKEVNGNDHKVVGDDDIAICSNNSDLITEQHDGEYQRRIYLENAAIGTIPLPHHVGQSQVIIVRQSESHRKRKLTEDEQSNKMNNLEEEEDDDDDDDEEVPSRSVKRPRSPSRPSTLSSTKQNTSIITHTLHCPQCDLDAFPPDKLNHHLKEEHSIDPFQCLVKDCGQSFTAKQIVGEHHHQCHQSISQWHCAKCPKHFTSYHSLSTHHFNYHQFGHFQCSYPACTFTGHYRQKVYCHYNRRHKSLVCAQSGCSYVAPNASDLKCHQQSHHQVIIKPYLCKWRHCHYASAKSINTLAHIGSVHLKHKVPTNVTQAQSQFTDAIEYLEVVSG